MNVEAEIIRYLSDCGIKAYADVPNPRPDEFVTVELTGGTIEYGRVGRPTVAIQSWSRSRYSASELAIRVDSLMRDIVSVPTFARCRRNSLYNFPDEAQARYQGVYDLVTY